MALRTSSAITGHVVSPLRVSSRRQTSMPWRLLGSNPRWRCPGLALGFRGRVVNQVIMVAGMAVLMGGSPLHPAQMSTPRLCRCRDRAA